MIKDLDVVVLNRDLPEFGLTSGDIGTAVHKYGNGEAYEVEFVTGGGETIAVVTIPAIDLRGVAAREILHVRKLAA
jgi:hypothetical protein